MRFLVSEVPLKRQMESDGQLLFEGGHSFVGCETGEESKGVAFRFFLNHRV